MRKTRTEQATVSYDECDGCGKICRTEARIDDENFDPRSRSWGFRSPCLWETHSWHDKSVCRECWGKRVFCDESFPLAIPGMVRVKIFDVERCSACEGAGCPMKDMMKTFCQGGWVYNKHGLRLHSDPPTAEEVESWFDAFIFSPDRTLAVPLRKGDGGYWLTAAAASTAGPEWVRDLADGERKVVLCEHTDATQYPTVLEPLYRETSRVLKPDPTMWGSELRVRTKNYRDQGFVIPVDIRVPIEILQ